MPRRRTWDVIVARVRCGQESESPAAGSSGRLASAGLGIRRLAEREGFQSTTDVGESVARTRYISRIERTRGVRNRCGNEAAGL